MFVVEILKKDDKKAFEDLTVKEWTDAEATAAWRLKYSADLFNGPMVAYIEIAMRLRNPNTTYARSGAVRFSVGDVYFGGLAYPAATNWIVQKTMKTFAFFPEGLKSLKVEQYGYQIYGGWDSIKIYCWTLSDVQKLTAGTTTVYIPANTQQQIFSLSIPKFNRKTVLGNLNPDKYLLFSHVYVNSNLTPDYWGGASGIVGYGYNLTTPSGSQDVQSTDRFFASFDSSGLSWMRLERLVDNVDQTLRLYAVNSTTSTVQLRFDYSVFACPWILPTDYAKLIDVDVPLESTLYAVIEALQQSSQVKYLQIREVNAAEGEQVIHSASQDPGATTPLSTNFTLQWHQYGLKLYAKGYGNALSKIAADLRG